MRESGVDQTMLDELLDIMGDDMQMLVDSYVADTTEKLEQLEKLNLANDSEAIFRLAHSLKGSSRNLGVTEFANYCELIEEKSRIGQLDENNYSHEQLTQLFESAVLVIKQKLAS